MSSNGDSGGSGPLRIIVGPTAAGKSALALALARENDGVIVSADSRQIYRGFDVGTAKPTAEERTAVAHAGVDVAEPTERWSAARFAAAADGWIRDAENAGRTPVVVGGTGFWIAALVSPLAAVPDLDDRAREALHAEFAIRTNEELREWCAELDPELAHLGPAQWRRAIEVALLTGRRLTEWHRDEPASPPRSVRYLLVDSGAGLDDRIAARVDEMFARGWTDEVRTLSSTVPETAIAWKACGYERLRTSLNRELGEQAVRDDIVRETRQYARRQRTWFRKQLKHGPVRSIDSSRSDALSIARAWWNEEGRTDE
jgi:tRNA dimethylallyltransferase